MPFERILDLRIQYDLKQKDMAKILKTSQPNYSKWENGFRTIPLKKLNLLCNHFQVSMDYIIGLSKENVSNGTHQLNYSNIGKKILEIRNKYNLTQTDIANFLNTTQSTISAYEKGNRLILTDFAIQLAVKYNFSLDYICGRKNM